MHNIYFHGAFYHFLFKTSSVPGFPNRSTDRSNGKGIKLFTIRQPLFDLNPKLL
jgi:hypothetical protein